MKAGRFFFLIGLLSVLLLGGCSEEPENTWEERQITLLREYLDKPGVTYGEIVIDPQKKEWTIKDYSLTMEYESHPGQKKTVRAKSITGIGVELEPVPDVRLFAKQLLYHDAIIGLSGTEYTVHVDEAIIENLIGGPEAQRAMLGFEDGILRNSIYENLSFDVDYTGVTVADGQGQQVATVEHWTMKVTGWQEAGPITVSGLSVTPSLPGLHSLSIEEVSLERATVINADDVMAMLTEKQLTPLDSWNPTVAKEIGPYIQYDVRGLIGKNISLLFYEGSPALPVKEFRLDMALDKGSYRLVWHVGDMEVTPELLKSLLPYQHMLGDYPFQTYTFSGDLKCAMEVDGEELKGVQVDTLALHEKNLGGFSLKFAMGKNTPEAPETNDVPAKDTLDAEDAPEIKGKPKAGETPETGDTPDSGDIPEGRQGSDSSELGLFGYEVVGGDELDYVKNVELIITDKGLLKTGFGLASVLSGTVQAGNAAVGGDMLRYGAAVAVSTQCGRYAGSLQKSCLDTVRFLNKGGTITFSFGFDAPVPLDTSAYGLNQEVVPDITSTYVAPAE